MVEYVTGHSSERKVTKAAAHHRQPIEVKNVRRRRVCSLTEGPSALALGICSCHGSAEYTWFSYGALRLVTQHEALGTALHCGRGGVQYVAGYSVRPCMDVVRAAAKLLHPAGHETDMLASYTSNIVTSPY
eukprot:4803513-Amphidinium_carterae.1